MDHWTESMSARSRVASVATTISQPRSVNWISEQAETGWQTAKDHIDLLVDCGVLRPVNAESGDVLYGPDPVRDYFDEIGELVAGHSRAELRDELQHIADEIDDWKRTYNIETSGELEETLADDDRSSDEVRERRQALRYWEENEEYRTLITNALGLYDEVDKRLDRSGSYRPPSEQLAD